MRRRDVEKIAELARLELAEDEAEQLRRELASILEHFEIVQELDLPGGAGSAPAPGAARLRPDRPGSDPLQLPLESLAPAWRDGFFLVPRPPGLEAEPDPDDPEVDGDS
jgi:aspartyl-tRNA(Asn)/glutamyl-tRNA(Gln) amidotransferase subunit C